MTELKEDYHTHIDSSSFTICRPLYGSTHLAIRIQYHKEKKCEHHRLRAWSDVELLCTVASPATALAVSKLDRPVRLGTHQKTTHFPVEGHFAQHIDNKDNRSICKAGDTAKVDTERKEELGIGYRVLLLQLQWW
jgi:hypothetical protein